MWICMFWNMAVLRQILASSDGKTISSCTRHLDSATINTITKDNEVQQQIPRKGNVSSTGVQDSNSDGKDDTCSGEDAINDSGRFKNQHYQ